MGPLNGKVSTVFSLGRVSPLYGPVQVRAKGGIEKGTLSLPTFFLRGGRGGGRGEGEERGGRRGT